MTESTRRPRVVAVVGPTATGKTDLALEIAAAGNAEIVNADSRQVYCRLDIGSAKPTPEQRAAVPHHLLDVVEPDAPFDVAEFHRLARQAIDDIVRRGRNVLVVGGTGLYIRVLRGGLFAGPKADPEMRRRLEAAEDAEPGWLRRRLAEVDPATLQRVHANDRMRLVRALEVFEHTGRSISDWQREHSFSERQLDMQVLGVEIGRDEIYRRIGVRCRAMLDAGLLDEVRHLLAAGLTPDLPALQSPGYREMAAHLGGQCTLAAALDGMAQATRHLAKRQLTWFRNDPELQWLAPVPADWTGAARSWWS